jgi:hypothetical protein
VVWALFVWPMGTLWLRRRLRRLQRCLVEQPATVSTGFVLRHQRAGLPSQAERERQRRIQCQPGWGRGCQRYSADWWNGNTFGRQSDLIPSVLFERTSNERPLFLSGLFVDGNLMTKTCLIYMSATDLGHASAFPGCRHPNRWFRSLSFKRGSVSRRNCTLRRGSRNRSSCDTARVHFGLSANFALTTEGNSRAESGTSSQVMESMKLTSIVLPSWPICLVEKRMSANGL